MHRLFYNKEKKRDITHYGQKVEQHIIPALVNRLENTSEYWKRKSEIKIFNTNKDKLYDLATSYMPKYIFNDPILVAEMTKIDTNL